MEENQLLIRPFLLRGYRSFGNEAQRFESLGKINFLIGPNNSGKSNVLRFLHHVYPNLGSRDGLKLDALDRHFPNHAEFRHGQMISLRRDEAGNYSEFSATLLPKFRVQGNQGGRVGQLLRVCLRRAELEGTADAWFEWGINGQLMLEGWDKAFRELDDRELLSVWSQLTNRQGGRRQDWFEETVRAIAPAVRGTHVHMIPAIRRIGARGTTSDGFSGEGLIERLVRLQNP